MTVVSDSGPLIALAKIDGLFLLDQLFPPVLIAPAVQREIIERGLARHESDAELLSQRIAAQRMRVTPPQLPFRMQLRNLGAGEQESILLAIEHRATWLLMDDWQARQAALLELREAGVPTQLKGTLGVIVSAHLDGHLKRSQAIDLIERIRGRPDIWVSDQLCDRVIASLEGRAT